jgi:hypothetical protein
MHRTFAGQSKRQRLILSFVLLLLSSVTLAQDRNRPSNLELAGITARGRLLAEYDVAAWHSTDAVLALKPQKGSFARYIAKKSDSGWSVAFGRFSDSHDKFLIVYEATQRASPEQFTVEKNDPPREDTGFYFDAARGIETALRDFQGQNRPYNVSVLPSESNQMYVYVVPAQTVPGIYPLGGDVRYLVSFDGMVIIERRQLHKAILEIPPNSAGSNPIVGGTHSHVLSDIPEDTDVFHVLTRKPLIPEYVGTKNHTYVIREDGSIEILDRKK